MMAKCKNCLHFEACKRMYDAAFHQEWFPFEICENFKDHYRAGYDFIMALQGELVTQHHTGSGYLDYKVVKTLAATYELQDYLANRIAQAVADGELEPDPED